ncbi:hypothetical protein [Streptomyces sp. 4F14]|uniref:hypothetical protein n=1 Tax=Streptomyces sp. 4F14 TaxID=3394380 RepID=UPI003A84C0E0
MTQRRAREELVGVLRACHSAVIAPHHDRMRAAFDSERATLGRAVLDGGVDGLLDGVGPGLRWRSPVLEVDYWTSHRPPPAITRPCCGRRG